MVAFSIVREVRVRDRESVDVLSDRYRGTSLIRTPPQAPTVGICLGSYGGPGGLALSYERGAPVCSLSVRCPCLNKTTKPRPESGLDCLVFAGFARQWYTLIPLHDLIAASIHDEYDFGVS